MPLPTIPAPTSALHATAARVGRIAGGPTNWYYLAGGGRTDQSGATGFRDVYDLTTGLAGRRQHLVGFPGATYVGGPWGRCLDLDGSGWADVDPPPLNTAPDWTITCVVRIASLSQKGGFYITGDGVTGGIALGVGSGTIDTPGNNLVMLFDQVAWVPSGVPIGLGWHAVSASYTTATGFATFSIDGQSVATIFTGGNPAPTDPAARAGIGAYYNGRGGPGTLVRGFTGQVADIKVYTYAQTARQIARDHADPFWRLRPYPGATSLDWLGTPQSRVTLGAVASPASTSLSLLAQPRPNMATLAAQAGPASIAWMIDGGSSGPLTVGEFYSILAPSPVADPWGVDPDETSLLN